MLAKFEEAIKKNHRFSDAYNNLGVVQYQRRKYRAAIKQYKRRWKSPQTWLRFTQTWALLTSLKRNSKMPASAYAGALDLIRRFSSTAPAPVSQLQA